MRKPWGFWYVHTDDDGFKAHEVDDTSVLVWFTVPKATGKGAWQPPYITENLGARVISYNVPVYSDGQFIGVIGAVVAIPALAGAAMVLWDEIQERRRGKRK